MNMDGFSKMLENCSNDELDQLGTLIVNQMLRNNTKVKEKIETLIKNWEDYKSFSRVQNPNEVMVQINIHDKNNYDSIIHKIKYTTVKSIHSDKNPAFIQIELNPIEV